MLLSRTDGPFAIELLYGFRDCRSLVLSCWKWRFIKDWTNVSPCYMSCIVSKLGHMFCFASADVFQSTWESCNVNVVVSYIWIHLMNHFLPGISTHRQGWFWSAAGDTPIRSCLAGNMSAYTRIHVLYQIAFIFERTWKCQLISEDVWVSSWYPNRELNNRFRKVISFSL